MQRHQCRFHMEWIGTAFQKADEPSRVIDYNNAELMSHLRKKLLAHLPINLDAFASALNKLVGRFYSSDFDETSSGHDAMAQTYLDSDVVYAYPPRVLYLDFAKICESQSVTCALVFHQYKAPGYAHSHFALCGFTHNVCVGNKSAPACRVPTKKKPYWKPYLVCFHPRDDLT